MTKLQPGDLVVVEGAGDTYNITRDGSFGYVLTTLGLTQVKFVFVPGEYQPTSEVFAVQERFLKKLPKDTNLDVLKAKALL